MKNRIPSYRLHKCSGLAVVTLDGKDYYLGKHGSEESHAEYRRLTGLYAANGMKMPVPHSVVTVNELLVRFYEHAQSYYRKAGQPTSQIRFYRSVCRRMRDLLGTVDVATLGVTSLMTLRVSWINDGNTRMVVNRKAMAMKRIIDWGVENAIVPGSVSHAVRAVRGLTRGRTTAPDREAVRPVSPDVLNATLSHLRPRTATMVHLQLLTGMRPGEVCSIRPRDLDRSGSVWIYIPSHHKTEHHGRVRAIAIGPRAQKILASWINRRTPESYIFSRSGQKPPPVGGYRRSITRAAKKAGVAPWGPNRLRHNFATDVRKQFGLDAAQVTLGHARCDVTQVYAEADQAAAERVAATIG